MKLYKNIINHYINHYPRPLEDSTIYSIIYQYGKLFTLYGMIQEQKDNLLYHSINIKSPGSQIFNNMKKLIGTNSNKGIGQCLYYPIKEFIKKKFL